MGRTIAGLMIALVCALPAMAQAVEQQGWLEGPWNIRANVYGWLPQAPADIFIDDTKVADLPESLDTILDSMSIAFMGHFEVQKGRLFAFASPVYYDGEYDDRFTGPISGQLREVQVQERVWLVDYGIGVDAWRHDFGADDSRRLTISPYLGYMQFHDPLRFNLLDADTGTLLSRTKVTVDIFTPIAGVKSQIDFNERWSLQLRGHYGVFDADKVEETYQIVGSVARNFTVWNRPAHAFVGYRHYRLEAEGDDLGAVAGVRVTAKGPIIGVGMSF